MDEMKFLAKITLNRGYFSNNYNYGSGYSLEYLASRKSNTNMQLISSFPQYYKSHLFCEWSENGDLKAYKYVYFASRVIFFEYLNFSRLTFASFVSIEPME